MDLAVACNWVANEIEQHTTMGPFASGRMTTATRLADAARALRSGDDHSQIFGLTIPNRDERFAPLYERAMAILSEWSQSFTEEEQTTLADFMHSLGLPTFASVTAPKTAVAELRIVLPASLVNVDREEAIIDPKLLQRLDGAHVENEDAVFDLPCMESVADDCGCGSQMWLEYDAKANALRGVLALEVSRMLSNEEVEALLAVVERDLFFSGWGLNLQWPDAAADGIVQIDPTPMGHSLEVR